MNYVDHCTEQNVPVPTVPLVFSKFGSCIVGPGDGIPIYGPSSESAATHGGMNANLEKDPVVTSKLDYEVDHISFIFCHINILFFSPTIGTYTLYSLFYLFFHATPKIFV